MCEPCTPDALLEAVRGLWLADPEIAPKRLLAKLREQQPGLEAGNKEVREALTVLKAEESKAREPAAAAAPPAAEASGTPPNASLAPNLACFGCARLPSEMGDGREKHQVSAICHELKIPTTYWCSVNCPGNPGAWKRHAPVHKEVRRRLRSNEDGGLAQQRAREIAEREAEHAARTGDEWMKLMAEGSRYTSQQDMRRAARAFREAIALRPDEPAAYLNLGVALFNSGHYVEAAQRYLEAKEGYEAMGYQLNLVNWESGVLGNRWALATAAAILVLTREECAEVAKPEWWNDEGLKALSARVVRAAPDDLQAHQMRAEVLRGALLGDGVAWEAGPRSAVELREAATHYERAAALEAAPAMKDVFAKLADFCRLEAEVHGVRERAADAAREIGDFMANA